MTSPELTTAAVAGACRPSVKTLLWAGVGSAIAASIVLWAAGDVAFYDRFHLSSNDLPSWSPWSALSLGTQAFAWCVMGALWFGCQRRHVVVLVAAVALAVGGLGVRAWAHHEADRAWAGTPVNPTAVLPFQFSARPATMIPYGTDQLPEAIPAYVLVLRNKPGQAVVYDPATRRTNWVGSKIAVPAWVGEPVDTPS